MAAATRHDRSAAIGPDPTGDRNLALGRLARNGAFIRRDFDQAVRVIARTAAATLLVERASVWLFDDDGESLVCANLYRASCDCHETGLRLDSAICPAYFAALRLDRIICVCDAMADPRTSGFAESYLRPADIGAMLDAPILHHGETVGVVCLERVGGTRDWTREDANFAASLADFVALALAGRESLQAEERAQQADRSWRELFEHAVEGMFRVAPSGRLLMLNPSLARLAGYENVPQAIDAMADVQNLFRQPEAHGELLRRLAIERRVSGYETELVRRDGVPVWVSINIRGVRGADGHTSHFDGTVEDITLRKRAEQQFSHLALHDALTNLPNRTLMMDRLSQSMRRVRSGQAAAFGAFLVDCDNLRLINHTLGRAAGDTLLTEMARRLDGCLQPGETLARIGSDDFCILAEGVHDTTQGLSRAESLRIAVGGPMELSGHEVSPSVSVAVRVEATGADSSEMLLRDLGIALHHAKQQGRGQIVAFEPNMRTAPLEAMRLTTELRRAIDRDDIGLAFQPVVSLPERRLIGFEALARWTRASGLPVSPAVFIPLAEESGLIRPLGRSILRQACLRLKGWQERLGHRAPSLSVNVSPMELAQDDLVDTVDRVLEQTAIDPAGLKLEVTETALAHDLDLVCRRLEALRQRGVAILIDDFGTGYSSLSRLHRLPFDALKIDQSFVKPMLHDPDSRTIIRTVVALAQALAVDVIAEGVEEASTGRELVRLGCTQAQGYFYAKPMTPEAAEALVERVATGQVPRLPE